MSRLLFSRHGCSPAKPNHKTPLQEAQARALVDRSGGAAGASERFASGVDAHLGQHIAGATPARSAIQRKRRPDRATGAREPDRAGAAGPAPKALVYRAGGARRTSEQAWRMSAADPRARIPRIVAGGTPGRASQEMPFSALNLRLALADLAQGDAISAVGFSRSASRNSMLMTTGSNTTRKRRASSLSCSRKDPSALLPNSVRWPQANPEQVASLRLQPHETLPEWITPSSLNREVVFFLRWA
jgi:hypothetical protein